MHQDPRSRNEFFKSTSIFSYLKEYTANVLSALYKIDEKELEKARKLLRLSSLEGRRIFVGGNGGSSSISDHLLCDFVKGCHIDGDLSLKVHSLNGSTALLTAIGNDFGYEHTFSFQLEAMSLTPRDSVILISSSGNSPNIVKAAELVKAHGATLIGMTGFNGGTLKNLADVKLHVPFSNYGIVEDSHQILMHTLAQWHFLEKSNDDF